MSALQSFIPRDVILSLMASWPTYSDSEQANRHFNNTDSKLQVFHQAVVMYPYHRIQDFAFQSMAQRRLLGCIEAMQLKAA